MEKVSTILILSIICLFGSVYSVQESVEHGSHGAEKNKPLHFKHGQHNSAYDIEALMGSRDYDELAELPDDVRLKRLTILAKSHDTNNNGIIEASELQEWILNSYRVLDLQDTDERFKDEDHDKDDKISFEEILLKQYGYTPEDVKELEDQKKSGDVEDKEILVLIEEETKRFAAADLDKDGFLNLQEFDAIIHPHDHVHMHEMEMARTMKEMDEDSDGFVSLKEFIRSGDNDDEERLAEETNFKELDKDKDGKLSSEELKPWAVFSNTESANEEVDHLIKECDENGDGHLSIEEIINKEDDFISNVATDYGRNLHFVKDEL